MGFILPSTKGRRLSRPRYVTEGTYCRSRHKQKHGQNTWSLSFINHSHQTIFIIESHSSFLLTCFSPSLQSSSNIIMNPSDPNYSSPPIDLHSNISLQHAITFHCSFTLSLELISSKNLHPNCSSIVCLSTLDRSHTLMVFTLSVFVLVNIPPLIFCSSAADIHWLALSVTFLASYATHFHPIVVIHRQQLCIICCQLSFH